MYDDYEDDDDMAMTISCPNCNADVYEDAPQCPSCGEYITAAQRPFSNRATWFRNLIVVVVILTILSFLLPSLLSVLDWFGQE